MHNYATDLQADATPLIWQLLDYCGSWRTVDDVRRAVAPRLRISIVRTLLRSMTRAGFCEASNRRRDRREAQMDEWESWNPAAGFFHTASRGGTYGDPSRLDLKLRKKAARTAMPSFVRTGSRRTLKLPTPFPSPFSSVLLDRRTWRQFLPKPIEHADLAALLAWTSGVTHWLTVPGLGEVPLTTSPSGGARHPLETYVFVQRVRGVPAGLYRYAGDRHELDVVSTGVASRELRAMLPRQPWFSRAAVVLFFTAVFERTAWRYEFPRAYRAVLLEAGHVCQTFLLAATSLGLAPFCTMALDDATVERALRIDGLSEAVIYAAGAGVRPAVDHRAVMPRGSEAATVRPNPVLGDVL